MSLLLLRNKMLLMALAVGAVLSFCAYIPRAHATAGDIQVTVTEESDSAAISGATVLVACTGGAATALTGSPTTNGSGVVLAAPQAGSSCDNSDSIDITVSKTGYVTKTVTAAGTYLAASNPNVYTVTNVLFPLKVIVTDELGTSLTSGVTATLGGGGSTISSSNTFYFANSTASAAALLVSKDGYVSSTTVNTGGVTTGTSTQVVITYSTGSACTSTITTSSSCLGLMFGNKVTGVADELSNALSSVTVLAGDSAGTTCTASGGAWYCAIPLANTTLTISAAKDGYVTNTGTSFGSDRTAATNAQVTAAVTGVKFSLKITAVDENSTAVTGATVTAGDSLGVTCAESGSTGVYYCIIPLAHTGVSAHGSVANHATTTGTYTDRTAATDIQGTLTFTMTGGGGGGGGQLQISVGTSTTTNTTSTTSNTSTTSIVAQSTTPVVVINASGETETTMSPGCSGGNAFNTSTGAPCKNNSDHSGGGSSSMGASAPAHFRVALMAGKKGADVTALQTFLSTQGFLKVPAGVSMGTYGSLTTKAVEAFQVKYGIAKAGQRGYGMFGLKTQAKANELSASM